MAAMIESAPVGVVLMKGTLQKKSAHAAPDNHTGKDAMNTEGGEKEEGRLHEGAILYLAEECRRFQKNISCPEDEPLCHIRRVSLP